MYADQDLSWLPDLPSGPVRHALRYLDNAYRRFHQAPASAKAEGGCLPRRKSPRGPKADGFTIPDDVNLDGNRLHIPRLGKVRLERGTNHPYRGCTPKAVRLLKEGTDRHPKWYATVVYAVPVARLPPPAADGERGVDRNAAVNILDRGFCTARGVWRWANPEDP